MDSFAPVGDQSHLRTTEKGLIAALALVYLPDGAVAVDTTYAVNAREPIHFGKGLPALRNHTGISFRFGNSSKGAGMGL